MQVKRTQVINYGPIAHLDIDFPFDGDVPKPVVLVGGNGSGKTIFLSHIVNGLIIAKDRVNPETPEVESGKAYKMRHDSYIKTGSEGYFSKVDFESGLHISEMRCRRVKREYESVPAEFQEGDGKTTWDQMPTDDRDRLDSNIFSNNRNEIEDVLSRNSVLYFPSNRFEEPAWLNQENLINQASYTEFKRLQGYTSRKLISYSPLHENQNWLFDVVYDRAVFEAQTARVSLPVQGSDQHIPLSVLTGFQGNANSAFEIALAVIRGVIQGGPSVRFGIGRRQARVVSLEGPAGTIVPNIFQLSSGETSLLNMFLSILRDFDLIGSAFSSAADIRGIVLVDEIDLHLHAGHQHEILPKLIQMFPNVQFIATTHSPLFVLGMVQSYGEDGFALYRMPQGQQISPEEFTEFGDAYRAFTATSKFSDDIRAAVRDAQAPILYFEGKTDIKYLGKAAELLGKESVLQGMVLEEGGGTGGLTNIWRALLKLSDSLVPRKIVLLFDCDYSTEPGQKGNRHRRTIPAKSGHPLEKGIENLFARTTLEKALGHKPGFMDIIPEHSMTIRGQHQTIPEQWVVNEDEKINLCDWLCENGTVDDFRYFQVIFDILAEVLGNDGNEECSSA